jgi:hypothetical protein
MTTTIEVLRWEEPPPPLRPGRPRGWQANKPDPYRDVAEQLRAKPGESAVLYEGDNAAASGLASTISSGLAPSFQPRGAFFACTRKQGDVTVTYAHYVGGGGL